MVFAVCIIFLFKSLNLAQSVVIIIGTWDYFPKLNINSTLAVFSDHPRIIYDLNPNISYNFIPFNIN